MPAFIRAFEILGYEPCQAHARERSYDKVAIYSKPVEGPTHAARLLRNGRWSSKIGVWELIEHDYEALTGHGPNEYGDIVQVMRRRKTLSRIVRDALLNRLDIIANFLEKQPP